MRALWQMGKRRSGKPCNLICTQVDQIKADAFLWNKAGGKFGSQLKRPLMDLLLTLKYGKCC